MCESAHVCVWEREIQELMSYYNKDDDEYDNDDDNELIFNPLIAENGYIYSKFYFC